MPKNGDRYFDLDGLTEYVYFNGHWVKVLRNVENVVNVLDFNADPSGANDSTEAFKRAFDRVKTGGKVIIPVGNYIITDSLQIYSNTIVEGQGWGSKIIFRANYKDCFVIQNHSHNIVIRDLFLWGDKDNYPDIGNAISAQADPYYAIGQILIENVKIEKFFEGIKINDAININIVNCWIIRCKRYGVKIVTDSVLFNCFVGENGLDLQNDTYSCNVFVAGWDCRITNNHIWGGNRGLFVSWANDVHIYENIIEENQKEGIYVYGRANGLQIIGNYLEDNSWAGDNLYDAIKIEINSGYTGLNMIISGNRFGYETNARLPKQRYCINVASKGDGVSGTLSGNRYENGYMANVPLNGCENFNSSDYFVEEDDNADGTYPPQAGWYPIGSVVHQINNAYNWDYLWINTKLGFRRIY